MQDLVIEAGHAERNYWRDLWRFRELFYFLAWRDILVRYKQTTLGIGWALIQPLLTMVVFSVIFGKIAKLPAGEAPYPLVVLSGLLPWQFFARAFAESGGSLITNANLVSKVYFPRLIVPAGAVMVGVVDLLISLGLLAVMMLWYHYLPTPKVLLIVLLVPVAVFVAAGPGFLIAALTVKYRDFRHVVPFVVQLGLYVSPVGFVSDVVPDKWRLVYSFNPVVGLIDLFRWSILSEYSLYLPGLAASLLSASVMLWVGITYFRHTERSFADII